MSFNYPIMLCNCCCVKFKMSSQISHAKAHHCLWITIFFYSVILQWIKKNYHLDVLAFDPLCKRVFCFHSVCWDGVHARGWTEVGKDCDPLLRPPRSPNLMSGSRTHCSWAQRSTWPPVYHSRVVWPHLPCQLQKKKIMFFMFDYSLFLLIKKLNTPPDNWGVWLDKPVLQTRFPD